MTPSVVDREVDCCRQELRWPNLCFQNFRWFFSIPWFNFWALIFPSKKPIFHVRYFPCSAPAIYISNSFASYFLWFLNIFLKAFPTISWWIPFRFLFSCSIPLSAVAGAQQGSSFVLTIRLKVWPVPIARGLAGVAPEYRSYGHGWAESRWCSHRNYIFWWTFSVSLQY